MSVSSDATDPLPRPDYLIGGFASPRIEDDGAEGGRSSGQGAGDGAGGSPAHAKGKWLISSPSSAYCGPIGWPLASQASRCDAQPA